MATMDVRVALERATTVLTRRPEMGRHADIPATARWDGNVGVVAEHPSGLRVRTDMPPELGGDGKDVTPGWLMRAGLAACSLTIIAMAAAAEGIELETLELTAGSESDARGILGLREKDGRVVAAGPKALELRVRIAARGVSAQRLRRLVEDSRRRSPVLCALEDPLPVNLHVEVAAP